MDILVLNSNFYPVDIIDAYTSFIWTERYQAAGDFLLSLPWTYETVLRIPVGSFISIAESKEVMLVETHEVNNGILKVTGSSLVFFLKQRMLRNSIADGVKAWDIQGAPSGIANWVVIQMCTSAGVMNSTTALVASGPIEIFPNLTVLPEVPGPFVTVSIPYGNVYDGVKSVCDAYDVGFRMYPTSITESSYSLIFETYNGRDLTSGQTLYPLVVFEPDLDSLTNIKELRSIAGYKNVAYAWAPGVTTGGLNIYGVAYATTAAITATGFDRRTLQVLVDDYDTDDYTAMGAPAFSNALKARAIDALANNNYVKLLDGEVVPQNVYAYGTDYRLGDIVELRGLTDTSQQARITEYIRSEDVTGKRSYPTLAVIT